MIFVFGSNLAGRHGAGAAKHAYLYKGAKHGMGIGHHGNSYAIPTKDTRIQTLPLKVIKSYVDVFVYYAQTHPELEFKVTRIGCGLAGYTDEQIAPMFMDAPSNCYFDTAWKPYLEVYESANSLFDKRKCKNYWGTN